MWEKAFSQSAGSHWCSFATGVRWSSVYRPPVLYFRQLEGGRSIGGGLETQWSTESVDEA